MSKNGIGMAALTIASAAMAKVEEGSVISVNGQTGTVILDAEDVGALPEGYHDAAKQNVLTAGEGITIIDDVISADASAGVSSFNTRTGAVVPGNNDYTATMVGAVSESNKITNAEIINLFG